MSPSLNHLISFMIGAVMWTLFEYVLHRFVGHSKSRLGSFTQEHRDHHREGDYFMPLLKKIRISCQVISTLAIISSLILSLSSGLAFTAGFSVFFICYEFLHKRAHTHPPRNSYGRWLRRHHFSHHFSAPRKNFGVTTPLWDLVFGTYESFDCIKLPAKKAMVWLIDEDTKEILPHFSNDYQYRHPSQAQSSSSV